MCFEKNMKNSSYEETCDCPMECNTISYSFSIVSTPFDPEELCPYIFDGYMNFLWRAGDFLMRPFYENKSPPQVVRKMMKIKNNISDSAMDYCKKNLAFRAEVIFKIATDSMSVTFMSRRLSFFDKMSAFGIY